jgi:hypothetical protein
MVLGQAVEEGELDVDALREHLGASVVHLDE